MRVGRSQCPGGRRGASQEAARSAHAARTPHARRMVHGARAVQVVCAAAIPGGPRARAACACRPALGIHPHHARTRGRVKRLVSFRLAGTRSAWPVSAVPERAQKGGQFPQLRNMQQGSAPLVFAAAPRRTAQPGCTAAERWRRRNAWPVSARKCGWALSCRARTKQSRSTTVTNGQRACQGCRFAAAIKLVLK